MKTLYVVRHAKSSWKFPDLDDIDRPLSKRGKRNAPEMGLRLAKKGIKPGLLVSSPAKRAFSTAKSIAKIIQYPKDEIRIDAQLYHGMDDDVLDVIRRTPDNMTELMIFGHNPGLTDMVNELSGSHIYNVPTCGIAAITFDTDRWEDVGKIPGKLTFFDYPKKPFDPEA